MLNSTYQISVSNSLEDIAASPSPLDSQVNLRDACDVKNFLSKIRRFSGKEVISVQVDENLIKLGTINIEK